MNEFEVVMICLSALVALGIIGLLVRVMTKPAVLFGVAGVMGWLLYFNTL